jgi:hypothetical protein
VYREDEIRFLAVVGYEERNLKTGCWNDQKLRNSLREYEATKMYDIH